MNNIAVVRIRGIRNLKPKIKKTFELLKLEKPNYCILVSDSPQMQGMIKKVQGYVAYGPITKGMLLKLLVKRGELQGKKLRDIYKKGEIEKFASEIYEKEPLRKYSNGVFKLHPPRKGHKNIKRAYPLGDLGKRPDMDKLIAKMM